MKYNSKNLIYQLICRESGGFDFLYMALKRHPDLVSDFTGFLFPLVSHALTDFFEVHLRRTINNQQEYLKVVLRLLEGLAGETASKAALRESGLLETWLDSCEASFGNKLSREEDFIN